MAAKKRGSKGARRPAKRSVKDRPADEVLPFDELVELFAEYKRVLGDVATPTAVASRPPKKKAALITKEALQPVLPVTRSRGRPQKRNLPPNIVRVDNAQAHGYSVRFQRNGSKQTKLFSDSVHGGWQGALAAATAWREEMATQLPPKARAAKVKAAAPKAIARSKNAGERKASKKVTKPVASTKPRAQQQTLPFEPSALEAVAPPPKLTLAPKAKAKPVPPPAPAPTAPQVPAARFRYDCGGCGGQIEKVTGSGRNFEHSSGNVYAIPDLFPTNTCQKCGKHYLSASEQESLETLLHLEHTLLNGFSLARRRVKTVNLPQ